MRLFCDQNIMVETVSFLQSLGHDAVSPRDIGISRADDNEILECAIRDDRILLTYNADFSDLRVFPVGTHSGIIRLRLRDQVAEALHPVLKRALKQLEEKDLSGKLVTITSRSIRIRGEF